MSESDKMGLFGSKDEITEEQTKDDNTSDKPQTNPPERYAPYNIDSDSETYDTEALSIMDINDIIGVQADTPEDSTLESEFAALSEVITDSKDEFIPQLQNPNDSKENVNISDNKPSSERIQDAASKEENTVEKEDPEQAQNSASLPSMSKSLQLIGEAYISDDSQEADSDNGEDETPEKSSARSETLKVSVAATEPSDPGTEAGEKESMGQGPDSGEEHFEETKTIHENKEASNAEKSSVESLEKQSDCSVKTELTTSVDSTDAAVINEPEIKCTVSETEEMDVEQSASSEELKKPIDAIPSLGEPENGKEEVKDDLLGEENLAGVGRPEESRDEQEPMEVDEPAEILTTPRTDSVAETIVDNVSKTENSTENVKLSVTRETLDIRPEIDEKLSEDIVDVKFSSRLDTITEESNVDEDKCSETAEERVDRPDVENSEEPEKIVPEASATETVQETIPKDEETGVFIEKQNEEKEKSLESSEKNEELVAAEMPLERQKETIEPMEIDDSEQEELKGAVETPPEEESAGKLEEVSNQTTKNQFNNDNVEKPLETTTESSKIIEPLKKDEFVSQEKSSNDSEPRENVSKTDEVVTIKSSDDSASKESFDCRREDEKMEVDGSLKTTSKEEKVSKCCDSLEIPGQSVVEAEMSVETIENKCGIDTVDDAPIRSLEREKLIEKVLESNIINKNIPEEKLDTQLDENGDNVEQENIKEGAEGKGDKTEQNVNQVHKIEEKRNEIAENENPTVKTDEDENEENSNQCIESIEHEKIRNEAQSTITDEGINKIMRDALERPLESSIREKKDDADAIEETSILVEHADVQGKKTEGPEDSEEIEMKKVPDTCQKVEDSEQENEKSEEPELVQDSVSNIQEKDSTAESSVEEKKKDSVHSEPIEMNCEKTANKVEVSISSLELEDKDRTEISLEEEKESSLCPEPREITSEETENQDELAVSIPSQKPEDKISQEVPTEETKANLIASGNTESSSDGIEMGFPKDESSDPKADEPPESPNDQKEEENVAKIVGEEETEKSETNQHENAESLTKISDCTEKFMDKMTEEKCETDTDEARNETEMKSAILCEEKQEATQISSEEEEKGFSRSELAAEVSNEPDNLDESEMKEDEIEDEMTLSVDDPDMFVTGENPLEENSRLRESPSRTFAEQEMDTEEKTETNLSEDTEEKNEEKNLVEVENRPEQSEETAPEKSSRGTICAGQMFNYDEQSQSTQEMMERILETDKGSINKILDEQEASDLETAAMNSVDKLPDESEDMLNKALADPMGTQNIDSLEGLLDLDLSPENDESNLKSVEPIVDKVMQESCDDIDTIEKGVDVALLMEENDASANPVQNENYETSIATKILNNDPEIISSSVEKLEIPVNQELQENPDLTDKDLEAFDLASVVTNPLDNVDPSDDTKINLAEDLLREIAVDEESKITLTEKLLMDDDIQEQDLLLSGSIEPATKMDMAVEVFLPVEAEPDMELAEDISLDIAVRDQVLSDVAAEIESLPATSEISELESAVKFLQESEEQDIESSLVLSPKLVEDVVDEMVENPDVGIFATEADICEDPSQLVAELESIIPDPIAISEAEIINEAAKLEVERKKQLSEKAKLLSPICPKLDVVEEEILQNKVPESPRIIEDEIIPQVAQDLRETEKVAEIIEHEPLKKSAVIPKTSILEERLKIPPKIEIPVGEIPRICESPSTPKTSLLIQRDARSSHLMKQLESPKSMDKGELKIVDTPRKDNEKHDFENVGSPRIILKIAKSAIADCSEPRSPKSPKIRSATNSPNPEDSPGQKLGKIKLKLSKGGHPSIISNDNIEEHCGQWHTEGSSSLSPLGMKIKFSKIPDSPSHQTDRHEAEEPRDQTPKHKFEEAKRTESPLGMKIKLSKTGDPTIVQQETKDSTTKHKDKFDTQQDSPKRSESSIGMKIKLSKSGDASIIQLDKQETTEEHKDGGSRVKDKLEMSQHSERSDTPRRTESPLGMKFKLFKTGDASIVQAELQEENVQDIKRTDSPVGKKSKQPKTRTTVVSSELNEEMKEKLEMEAPRRTESPLGMKIKLSKRGDASIIHNDESREAFNKQRPEVSQETTAEGSVTSKTKTGKTELPAEMENLTETPKRVDPSIGMKIKLSKSGDASIVHSEREERLEELKDQEKTEILQENTLKIDSSIGMKIKLSKTGDASIIASASTKKSEELVAESENSRITETEKKDKSSRRKDTEMPLEMKIKLSKTGHPTIVACDNYPDSPQRNKEINQQNPAEVGTSKQSPSPQENSGMEILKSVQGGNLHVVRSELTIEPVQLQARKSEIVEESASKRKDITISPVESKKAKLEAKLSHILPEVTIQPVAPRDQKHPTMFDSKPSSISRQQMNVISQEISITQVRPSKPMDLSMTDKLKSILTQNAAAPSSDCEIIEHRPELIIVNENSNSSQDVMIIEEVPVIRPPETKVPKKRGRPRRNPLPIILAKPTAPVPGSAIDPMGQRDPLALDDVAHMPPHIEQQMFPPTENEAHGRPKRTCRNQKSYAPPRRGRGRGGRGKRKMDMNLDLTKRPRIEQDLDMIERSTTALITIHDPPSNLPQNIIDSSSEAARNTSELYKALRQPTMDRKMPNALARNEVEQAVNESCNNPDLMTKNHLESLMDARIMSHLDGVINTSINKTTSEETFEKDRKMLLVDISSSEKQTASNLIPSELPKSQLPTIDHKIIDKINDDVKNNKNTSCAIDRENWLTPSSRKLCEAGRSEANISNVQVMDEETRMSAESGSRSQTPAKNMSLQAPETIVNEESQGSVLSTATTESEKVKVKIRRMEISFDPDEGPFTVEKVAEYDWPLDPTKKNETFMIQEQISHYLGVKSFKRKYPDLKRRMVDMEERNFLRENGLVSEAMCDMGLTAVLSSEVLDVMCSDFPDQYEEYRKHIREKQMKEHLKKQKELTAAANAEKNRIDLAEMAVQSALSWNIGLNKARRESRKCSLDLQTFTIHVPKKQQKVEERTGSNHYPVALIPGQYTDYYREYTPAELRYYPLNTVLYGPMRPNERKFDSQSEGSQSDSDSDSSSDDSSSTSSEGTQDTEASQSTMDDVDAELSRQKEDIKSIKCKMCLKHLNKFNRSEVLIQCGTCNGFVHPSCIDLTLDMVPHIQAYAWQCTDCKTCAQCHDPADEDKMLFCDMCDRGYHIYCVGLRRVPQGRWHCQECAVCASCGSREAGGTNSDRNSVAQWQHEYKKGDKNTRVYVSTLCVPCSKLCGEQGPDGRPEKLSV